MISPPHELGTAAAAAAYHKASLVDPDLNLPGGQAPGLWQGRGAELLGLSGEVEEQAFLNVLSGRHPVTGEQQTARLKEDRRTGWDWVFVPHKSVSVAWGLGGNDRLKEAHLASVQTALQALERFAAARVRTDPNSREDRPTGNLIYSLFTHDTARPASEGEVSDVFLHTHAVIANLTFDAEAGENGGWRALETNRMLQAREMVDAVYCHELARRLRELGYDVVPGEDGKSVALADVPKEAVELFSKRHADIAKRTAEIIDSGAASNPQKVAAVVAHQGRAKKDVTTTREELKENWRQQLVNNLSAADAGRFFAAMRKALGRASIPPAELTPAEFAAEHARLERRTAAAEKTPGRRMTPEEVALSEKDWRAFSKHRGYTEGEIADFGRWLELHGGFTAKTLTWSAPEELHKAVVAAAAERGEPVSAKAVEAYGLTVPEGYVPNESKTVLTRPAPKPPAELTPAEFEAEYRRVSHEVASANKDPNRKLTPEEAALWVKDWKEFAKQRGYTEAETAAYERWRDLNGGSKAWKTPEDEHRAAARVNVRPVGDGDTEAAHRATVREAARRGNPISEEAIRKYRMSMPDCYEPNGKGQVVRVITEAAALAWAVDHCFERGSVVPVPELVAAALRYAAGSAQVSGEGLQTRLRTDPEFIFSKDGARLTTRTVASKEKVIVGLVQDGRGQHGAMVENLPAELSVAVTPELAEARALATDAAEGCPTFTADDLTDAAGLIERLSAMSDPLSKEVWERFPSIVQTALLSDAPEAVKAAALAEGLNVCIGKDSLFTPRHFDGLELSDTSKSLRATEPFGRSLMRLNRSLLDDAYPGALRRANLTPAAYRRDCELSWSELCGKFSEAQRRAVLDTVANRDFLSVFRGGAGRGKSFALVCLEKLLESEGTNVVVAAPQTNQVNSLTQDRGRPALTVSSMLAMRKPLPLKTVLLVDEAGQLGSETMFSLLTYAKEYNARVILSGDTAQHTAVEAGDSMRLIERFTDANRATLGTEVHEIKRQHKSWFREVVALAERGKPAEAFDKLVQLDKVGRAHEARSPDSETRADKARIHEFRLRGPDGKKPSKAAADDARRRAVAAKAVDLMVERGKLTDERERKKFTHLVISQTNKEVKILNTLIREAMVEKGLLTGEERSVALLDPNNCTSAEKGLSEIYGENTRLLAGLDLRTEDPAVKIPKGAVLKFVGLEQGGRMRVSTGNGQEHVLSKEDGKKLSIGNLEKTPVRVGDLLRLRETLQVGIDLPGKGMKLPDGTVRRHTHKRRIPNGSIVKVVGWDKEGRTIIEVEEGKQKLRATLTRPILATRGYATTSYGAQGQTVRFVLYSDSGSNFVTTARQWYVDVSRATKGLWIFTNDKLDLRKRIQTTGERELAHELLAELDGKPGQTPKAAAKGNPEPSSKGPRPASESKPKPDEEEANPFAGEPPADPFGPEPPDDEPAAWASEPEEIEVGVQTEADPDDEDVAAFLSETEGGDEEPDAPQPVPYRPAPRPDFGPSF